MLPCLGIHNIDGGSGRSRKSGGAGLGLAMVEMTMQKHKGSTTITIGPFGGARFVLTWSPMSPYYSVSIEVIAD